MPLERLSISNFRNLSQVDIKPSPGFNLIYGDNGSGKTSLLEAIYCLSFGRSFRTRFFNRLIQDDQTRFLISSHFDDIPVGIERHRDGDLSIRFQKQDISSIAELAKLLPVQLIHHGIYQLIEGGPKIKRQFIDWGVFHVKHIEFLPVWKKFKTLLKQRNAALKMKSFSRQNVLLWDEEISKAATMINDLRCGYLFQLESILKQLLSRLLNIETVKFVFYPGWEATLNLQNVLGGEIEKDIQFGYTHSGPHRADLKILVNDLPAAEILSRGQQKIFACMMQLAQAALLEQQKQKKCIFLIDDLSAELDREHMKMMCNLFHELRAQVFLTSTRSDAFEGLYDQQTTKMFHVKQGAMIELNKTP